MVEDVNRVFLLPGEYMISKQPHIISTLLGSCVAVCLYHPGFNFGGMNHYMLAQAPDRERSGKYGDYAIGVLMKFMQRACGSLAGVEGMIFGGANVIGNIVSGQKIGERNIILAREMLQRNGVKVVKEQVGGNVGLKLQYRNWDNKIRVVPINAGAMSRSLIVKEEADRFSPPRAGSTGSGPTRSIPPQNSASELPVSGRPIKVLIVDDSAIVRSLLAKALADEPGITVVGEAKDAFEAREMLLESGPDVITLDIIMPRMDGVTFLKKLMVYHPIPVIICSTIAKSGSRAELRSDLIGAVDVIDKESLNLYGGLETVKKLLIPKIRAAAKVKVQRKTKEQVADL